MRYPVVRGVFQARVADPGMRWSRPNVERMPAIRAAALSDGFDHLWALAA